MNLSGFSLNIDLNNIQCHAILSSYLSETYSMEMIVAYWIRTQCVFIPYGTFPQSLVELIGIFVNGGKEFRQDQHHVELNRDYSHIGSALFISKEHPIMRLKANRRMYKLAFFTSNSVYCDNYIDVEQKRAIHKNLGHIQFRRMDTSQQHNTQRKTKRKFRYWQGDSVNPSYHSNAGFFPSITFVEKK